MFIKIFRTILVATLINTQLLAADINIVGTIDVKKPFKRGNVQALSYQEATQNITLLKLNLSNKAQKTIGMRLKKSQQATTLKTNNPFSFPTQIELGMNDVPVLNQGAHGSCVVFSITAAIDAIIGKGDYVSQLCQLGLGRYLENNGYSASGWNGSWGRTVLSQIDIFGFASKESQREYGCAGLTEYPMCGEDLTVEESAQDFHKISEQLTKNNTAWSSILDVYQVSSDKINEEQILLEVKKSLHSGDRVALGMLLFNFNQGVVGAIGTYKEKFDTWIITPEMIDSINNETEFGGHALLITGYNDSAIATDEKGRDHKGLLTLRNSWGSAVGDQGNFYMSYDYFKGLMIEAQRIRHL